MFYLLWSCGPVFVSVIAFFAYVMQGKELTIGTAFTVSFACYCLLVISPQPALVDCIVQHD